ncbi:MAG TPA: triose-phosphate isomerase [Chlamydiales bacterium]|nr:triose-phosphate isomerase [Chlamydiales bacterium]
MGLKPYLIGNWKMYKTAREAVDFIETFVPLVAGYQVNFFLAVPFTSIASAAHIAKNTALLIGAQNMHESREGAFTGEIASLMLKEAGAAFVLIGHCERRALCGETDETVRKKIIRALADDLLPILCIGESWDEKESGDTEKVLKKQIISALHGIQSQDAKKILLSYEPVWAIGTGKSATPGIAQKAHAFIRSELTSLFGSQTASQIPILYGGSVNPGNAKELIDEPDINGLLVGGASLDPEIFAQIAKKLTEKNL